MQVLVYNLSLVKFVESNQHLYAFYPVEGVYGLIGSAPIVKDDIKNAAANALVDAARNGRPNPIAWYNPNSKLIELSSLAKKPLYQGPPVSPVDTVLFTVTEEFLHNTVTGQVLSRTIPDSASTIQAIQSHSLSR